MLRLEPIETAGRGALSWACVRSGISGWVIGLLIRGRAGAERRAANSWSPVLAAGEARLSALHEPTQQSSIRSCVSTSAGRIRRPAAASGGWRSARHRRSQSPKKQSGADGMSPNHRSPKITSPFSTASVNRVILSAPRSRRDFAQGYFHEGPLMSWAGTRPSPAGRLGTVVAPERSDTVRDFRELR